MTRNKFTELFTYMEKKFAKVYKLLEEKASKKDVDRLAQTVNAYAKKADTYMQEMTVMGHQVNRLDRQINS